MKFVQGSKQRKQQFLLKQDILFSSHNFQQTGKGAGIPLSSKTTKRLVNNLTASIATCRETVSHWSLGTVTLTHIIKHSCSPLRLQQHNEVPSFVTRGDCRKCVSHLAQICQLCSTSEHKYEKMMCSRSRLLLWSYVVQSTAIRTLIRSAWRLQG